MTRNGEQRPGARALLTRRRTSGGDAPCARQRSGTLHSRRHAGRKRNQRDDPERRAGYIASSSRNVIDCPGPGNTLAEKSPGISRCLGSASFSGCRGGFIKMKWRTAVFLRICGCFHHGPGKTWETRFPRSQLKKLECGIGLFNLAQGAIVSGRLPFQPLSGCMRPGTGRNKDRESGLSRQESWRWKYKGIRREMRPDTWRY